MKEKLIQHLETYVAALAEFWGREDGPKGLEILSKQSVPESVDVKVGFEILKKAMGRSAAQTGDGTKLTALILFGLLRGLEDISLEELRTEDFGKLSLIVKTELELLSKDMPGHFEPMIPGGGSSLYNIIPELRQTDLKGTAILNVAERGLQEPLIRMIAKVNLPIERTLLKISELTPKVYSLNHLGLDSSIPLERRKRHERVYGVNLTQNRVEEMKRADILDPLSVVMGSFQNAVHGLGDLVNLI